MRKSANLHHWGTVLVLAMTAAITGCSSSGEASNTTTTTSTSTTTTSPPSTTTTSPPSTTSTTTIPPTTVPPPPVSSTAPVDPSVAEINQRLDAIWKGWNVCLADPATCNIDAFIAEFATPDSVAARVWRNKNGNAVADQLHSINLDKIEPFVASVDVTGSDAITEVCYRDGATAVTADGSVVDDSVVLYRFEWVWSKIDGRWMIVGGTNYQITDAGDAICDAYFQ